MCDEVIIEISGCFNPVHLRKVKGGNLFEMHILNRQKVFVTVLPDAEGKQFEFLLLLPCQIVRVIIDQNEEEAEDG